MNNNTNTTASAHGEPKSGPTTPARAAWLAPTVEIIPIHSITASGADHGSDGPACSDS